MTVNSAALGMPAARTDTSAEQTREEPTRVEKTRPDSTRAEQMGQETSTTEQVPSRSGQRPMAVTGT